MGLSTPVRTLSVCADDFGAAPSISDGIEQLAQAGALAAVSCLVNGPHWADAAQRLRHWPKSVALGLHFNLTEGVPLSEELRRIWPQFPGLGAVLAAAFMRRLPLAALACEWRAQWQEFERAVCEAGQRPAYIDGHQHVHHLPGVRDLWLRTLCAGSGDSESDLGGGHHTAEASARRGVPGSRAYILASDSSAGCPAQGAVHRRPEHAAARLAVRSTANLLGPGWAFKRQVIRHTGGLRLETELQARGVAHNRWLLGAYDFRQGDYRALMKAWLAALPADARSPEGLCGGALLFCHPGMGARPGEPQDAIAQARWREWQYLRSPAFRDDLAEAGVKLVSARRSSRPD
jgi:predicted glycoside hydrolase/deacetylase ChbG (UPF0249 family)